MSGYCREGGKWINRRYILYFEREEERLLVITIYSTCIIRVPLNIFRKTEVGKNKYYPHCEINQRDSIPSVIVLFGCCKFSRHYVPLFILMFRTSGIGYYNMFLTRRQQGSFESQKYYDKYNIVLFYNGNGCNDEQVEYDGDVSELVHLRAVLNNSTGFTGISSPSVVKCAGVYYNGNSDAQNYLITN